MTKLVKGGGVTSPKGFLASGAHCGIKKSGKKDLAILYSQVPAIAQGAFTANRFAASPVKLSRLHLKANLHQAVIVNSGNANCANGASGDRDALLMARVVAKGLFLRESSILVASTGIIGKRMPMEKIEGAIPGLLDELSSSGGSSFAETILTTDNVRKEVCVRVRLGGATVTIGGAAKGVGMIYPNLETSRHATMLCFITTDANIGKGILAEALRETVDDSFNMISVDGDMSTNDSVFILANGLADNRKIIWANRDFDAFKEALGFLTKGLAKRIVEDGEGATKIIEVVVRGAKSLGDARRIARKVTTSNLLKTCVFGGDPNWGRVVASCGSSGVPFDPDRVDVYLGNVKVLSRGASVKSADKAKLKEIFGKKQIRIAVDLKSGHFSACALTCDLSDEYIRINSEYST